MYCRSFLVQLVLCAAVLLALFVSTSHADDYDTYSVAIVIQLDEAVPTEWLESDEYGKCVSYGGLMNFGKKAAGHLVKWMQETAANMDLEDDEEIPENFLKNVKYHVTLDNTKDIRIAFYGNDESAYFVWEIVFYHQVRSNEYEDLDKILKLAFANHCTANTPVIPPVHDPTTLFPEAFTPRGLFFRVYDYPSTCSNGKRDGNETDVDCGGDDCPSCPLSRSCTVNEDCAIGYECSSSDVCKSTFAPSYNAAVGSVSIVFAMMISLALMPLMWGVV